MNQELELETENEEQFPRGLGVSFALHALIISFLVLKAAFFTPEQIDFSQAIRVDVVGLPDKLETKTPPSSAKDEARPVLPEKEPIAEKPVEKAVEKVTEKVTEKRPHPVKPEATKAPKAEKDAINLEKTKSQQKNAIEKLKAMAALEKIKESVAQQKTKPTGKDAGGAAKVKGNILSPGSSLTGLAKLQHDSYAVDLDHHIKQHWALPEWLANRDFKAQARVYIDSNGNILGRKIIKTSGNQSYDDEVLATIDRSAPFPAPPEKFVSVVEVDGILIGFPE